MTSNQKSLVQSTSFSDFFSTHAINETLDTYGDTCIIKPKSLHKFGEYDSVGTSEVLVASMGQNETYVSTNAIDKISSSSGSDTSVMTVEGHTISGSSLTFVTQQVTLTGQSAATLATPLARVSRAYTGTNLVGDVYIHEADTLSSGVPQTPAKIHMKVLAGANQSRKAATSFSSVDYFYLTQMVATVGKKTAATVDIRLKTRTIGSDFRTIRKYTITQSSPLIRGFRPYLIIPKNSDLIITAAASTTGVDVSADFDGLFGLVQS